MSNVPGMDGVSGGIAQAAGAIAETVGANFTKLEDVDLRYQKQINSMQNLIADMKKQQANPPEEWTGKDADALAKIIKDASEKLELMMMNISGVRKHTGNVHDFHITNSNNNVTQLVDAYLRTKI